MEDKRTTAAIIVSLIFVMLYTQLVLAPKMHKAKVPNAIQHTNSETVAPTNNVAVQNSKQNGTATPTAERLHPSAVEIQNSPRTKIETDLIKVEISHLGGRVTSLKLKKYKEKFGEETELEMVTAQAGEMFPLAVQVAGQNDDYVNYTLQGASQDVPNVDGRYLVGGGRELSLNFTGKLSDGTSITKVFRFHEKTYLFNVDIALSQAANDGSKIWLEWTHFVPGVEKLSRYDTRGFVIFDIIGKTHRIMMQQVVEGIFDSGPAHWVSLADKYFMSTIIPTEPNAAVKYGKDRETFMTMAAGSASGGRFTLYVGPKDYRALKELNLELERTVDLGWFFFLAYPLLLALNFFHSFLNNYGLCIIILTLSIKALFLPLTRTSLSSMQAMQELKPELDALKERVKDPAQLQQEMMALYKRKGVNPLGGCLPILIQIPVFLGLYNALLNSIELRHAPFALWIHDLSAPEALMIYGVSVPVMILIMGVSMFIQQWTTPSTGDVQQQRMMMIMPVMFTAMFIIFPMPAGLVLYWLVNNIISIVQQVYLKRDRRANPIKPILLASVAIFVFGFILTRL